MFEKLKKYGLTDDYEQRASEYEGLFLARVSEQHRELYKVIGEKSELTAEVSGKLLHVAANTMDFPAVGDWVMVDREVDHHGNAIIHHLLQRKSVFARQAAGTSNEQQVIAANIDTVFICMSLNADFNLRRVERYLTIAWDSLATPVIILTKSDLCNDIQEKLDELSSVSIGVEVIVCSVELDNLQAVEACIKEGETIAFIGSSGVGKSTLINHLMGKELLVTRTIRAVDDKGRHTTTHRQLLLLPSGGIVIDTPGMRELQIHSGDLSKAFEDIEELNASCRFSDCSHKSEPGCMVKEALENGLLDSERYENYLKLQREIVYSGLNSRQTENEKIERMFGGKNEMKQMMRHLKKKR